MFGSNLRFVFDYLSGLELVLFILFAFGSQLYLLLTSEFSLVLLLVSLYGRNPFSSFGYVGIAFTYYHPGAFRR